MTKTAIQSVLHAIGELSSNGLLLFRLKTKSFTYTNDSLLKIFDISHKTFAHEPAFFLNHIIHEDLEYLKLEYQRLLSDQKVENVEFRIKMHEGAIKDISCDAYLIDNKYIVAILKDISSIREHEDYIINYSAKKDTLLDMVTHNLSGPLAVSNNILSSLETVAKANDIKTIGNHITLVKDNTQHCIEILNDFLEEEHLVSEHISVKINRIEINEKIQTILDRMIKSYPDLHFKVIKNFETAYINTDDIKLYQIISNLLSNAVKWSRSGSTIEIILEDHPEYCVFKVRDYGIGIPEHLKKLLFEKYTPASRPGLKGEKSTGMGLYIIRKLANLLHGTITFESVENKGSTFTLTLQRRDAIDN